MSVANTKPQKKACTERKRSISTVRGPSASPQDKLRSFFSASLFLVTFFALNRSTQCELNEVKKSNERNKKIAFVN